MASSPAVAPILAAMHGRRTGFGGRKGGILMKMRKLTLTLALGLSLVAWLGMPAKAHSVPMCTQASCDAHCGGPGTGQCFNNTCYGP